VLLPLDDLLAVTREFLHPDGSSSGLDRCLRRHGVSNLQALIPPPAAGEAPTKTCKDYAPGFVPVDIRSRPQMPDGDAHRYLFVTSDRASRGVFLALLGTKTAAHAAGFLQRLVDKALFPVQKVLTDHGKEFTDRFCATGERDPTGRHHFDRTCVRHGIEHRSIKPRHPSLVQRQMSLKGGP
jgi:hypothetical protein